MNDTERKQIKPQLLKCAKENENKGTFTGYVIVSSVCRAAVERIEELEAGLPQWHTPDVRLPEEEGDYLFCLRDGEETMYDIVGVSIDGNGYVSLDSHIWSITDVIAWCELPQFKELDK